MTENIKGQISTSRLCPLSIVLDQYVIIPHTIANPKSEILAQTASTGVINDETLLLSRNHPQTSRLLGIARMPDHTALLHPGGRGDDEPCHLPARARTRANEI